MPNKARIDLTDFPQLSIKNNVLIFKDVFFLYQNHESCQFQYLLGNTQVDQKNIDIFQSNIEHNVNLASRYGFLYKHIVFPAKPTAFKPRFKSIGIDIRPLFSKAHEHKVVYYPSLKSSDFHKEDTHCNILGDIKIVHEILQELLPDMHLANPLLSDEVHVLDLAKNLNVEYKGTKVQVLVGLNDKIMSSLQTFSLSNALTGATGTVSYAKNPYAFYKKRLALFGDSCFQQIMWNVFASYFSEVLFFRNPYIMEDIVKNYEPDIVLSANAERYLIKVPDSRQPIPWFLHFLSHETFDNNKVNKETFNALVQLFVKK